jgi:hypothetical protein
MNVFNKYGVNDRMLFAQFSDLFLTHDTKHSYQISQRGPIHQSFPSDRTTVFNNTTNQIISELLVKILYIENRLIDFQTDARKAISDIKLTFQLLLQPKYIDKSTGELKVVNKYLLADDVQALLNQFGFPADLTDSSLLVKMYTRNSPNNSHFTSRISYRHINLELL